MLILIAIVLALIPAVAILYPFFKEHDATYLEEDESSTSSELSRLWEVAVAGLRTAELERAIGNLTEDDYRSLREQYMNDAALVLKAMDLEEQQEEALLAGINREVQQVRRQVLGGDDAEDVPDATRGREASSG